MALPQRVIDHLNDNARREGIERLEPNDDLFRLGVLDSFAIIDLVNILEEQCGVKVSDAEVNPGTFQTIERIGQYIESRKG